MKKVSKFLISLLLTASLALGMLPAYAAEAEPQPAQTVMIGSVEDFLAFAENCRKDDYSKDMLVCLEKDIDLTGIGFAGVPIFAGTFAGGGHTISGMRIETDGSVLGLFRYLTDTALVKDLSVQGTIRPEGTRQNIGGIAGSNAGRIENCSFNGTVTGNDSVGLLVGMNRVSGVIDNCISEGMVTGNHFVGGVAGKNLGVVRSCTNKAAVNTTTGEKKISLSEISRDTILGTESANTVTDVGGIAGSSSGVIRSCTNRGAVGYQRMGYNVGGIAGTNSGLIAQCTNSGKVSGRKEIAGIAGQLEPVIKIEYAPDTLQILQGQLQQTASLADRASDRANSNGQELNRQMNSLHDQAKVSAEAVGEILFKDNDSIFPDPDRITAAKNTLEDSMGQMQGTVDNMLNTSRSGANMLTSDIKAITNQVHAMSQTIAGAQENVGVTFTDVSDQDTDDDNSSKILECVNRGTVSGDLNVGGIAGIIAQENDLDPEDDREIIGGESLNADCELRSVIKSCENAARVEAKKKNAGGIVGKMRLGLVKDCTNTGFVDAETAEKVGGIAGESYGFIRSCFAKCALSGKNTIGGIAGTAKTVTDCRSMTQLRKGAERLGSILGVYDNGGPIDEKEISGNYYLSVGRDKGGIDGVSYAVTAQSMTKDEFLALENLPPLFGSAVITFWDEEGEKLSEQSVPLGEAMDVSAVPEVPQKEGFVARWEGLEEAAKETAGFDHEFVPEYTALLKTIESGQKGENGKPVLLAEGVFVRTQQIETVEMDNRPQEESGTADAAWTIPDFDGEEVTKLRVACVDLAQNLNRRLFTVDENGEWTEREFQMDGSYLVFDYDAAMRGVCVLAQPSKKPLILGASGAAGAAAVILLAVLFRRKKRRAKKQPVKETKPNE